MIGRPLKTLLPDGKIVAGVITEYDGDRMCVALFLPMMVTQVRDDVVLVHNEAFARAHLESFKAPAAWLADQGLMSMIEQLADRIDKLEARDA